jgi:hypothetical protein
MRTIYGFEFVIVLAAIVAEPWSRLLPLVDA